MVQAQIKVSFCIRKACLKGKKSNFGTLAMAAKSKLHAGKRKVKTSRTLTYLTYPIHTVCLLYSMRYKWKHISGIAFRRFSLLSSKIWAYFFGSIFVCAKECFKHNTMKCTRHRKRGKVPNCYTIQIGRPLWGLIWNSSFSLIIYSFFSGEISAKYQTGKTAKKRQRNASTSFLSWNMEVVFNLILTAQVRNHFKY